MRCRRGVVRVCVCGKGRCSRQASEPHFRLLAQQPASASERTQSRLSPQPASQAAASSWPNQPQGSRTSALSPLSSDIPSTSSEVHYDAKRSHGHVRPVSDRPSDRERVVRGCLLCAFRARGRGPPLAWQALRVVVGARKTRAQSLVSFSPFHPHPTFYTSTCPTLRYAHQPHLELPWLSIWLCWHARSANELCVHVLLVLLESSSKTLPGAFPHTIGQSGPPAPARLDESQA